jgi:hypothetical protein
MATASSAARARHEHRRDAMAVGLGGVSVPVAVGGAALLTGETDGFATDFTYATDASRVAVKVSNVVTSYALNSFYSNAGTSPKQVWDVNGVLGWSPHNMCLRSQEFNQTTPWTATALTVTADAIAAPDGTMTADRLVETATTANHQITHSTIVTQVGQTYTVSVYAKAGERNWLSIVYTNTTPADWFDLATGTVGTSANGGVMTDAGNGWWRCSITLVSPGNFSPCFHIKTANGQVGTYAGNTSMGLYLWGAQLNRGSTPQPYFPTTTAARFGLAVDYDPVTLAAKGLLCEPQATNLILNNASMSTQSVTVSAVAYTLSFWGTGTVTLSGVSTAGPLVGTGAGDRVSLTFTPTAGSLTLTVSGTVSNAQLETGSVASSIIPTFAASATRALDRYNLASASINYGATAGSWWADLTVGTMVGGGRIIVYTTSTSAPLYVANGTNFGLVDAAATVLKPVGSVLGAHKIASAFQSADRAVTADGLAAVTNATAGVALLSPGATIYVGGDPGGSLAHLQIRKLTYRPRRVTNADLATETA